MSVARFGSFSKALILVILLIPALAILPCVTHCVVAQTENDNATSYIYLDLKNNDEIVLPDETVSFQIIVRNLGDEVITYNPPATNTLGLPLDWTVSYLPATSISIPGNEYRILLVNITASSDAKANTNVELSFEGTTSNPDAEIIPVELRCEVDQIQKITFSTIEKITFPSPKDPINVEVSITNNGNGDDRIALELTKVPDGLTLSEEAQEFIISPGSTVLFTVTLFPSSNLTAGIYKLNFSLYRVDSLGHSWVSSQELLVEVVYYPDLYVSTDDIEITPYSPTSGEEVSINVTVHNNGDSDARNIKVRILPITKKQSQLLDIKDQTIEFLAIDTSTTIQVKWTAKPAVNRIFVNVDPNDSIGETDEKNNHANYSVYIGPIPPQPPPKNSESGEFTIGQLSAIGIIGILIGVTLASSGFMLTTEYGKYASFKFIAPFYTRVKKDEVLNHEVRELVYDYVKSHPGEHFRAILTKLGLTNGTLIHHLQTLERQEFIKSERDGPFKRFYPTGRQFTEDVLEINGIQKKILDAVTTNPGMTQKDLAAQLQTSPPTINYHVKALRGVRLLNIKRDGKNTRCFPGNSMNGWYRRGEVS